MATPDLTEAQSLIDATVVEWPEVHAKQAFGHRGYVRHGKMFGFVVGEGVAIKAWAGEEAEALYARDGVTSFSHSGMEMRAWPILPLRTEEETEAALTALQHAYERAGVT
jgi:hypothetical protein